MRYKFDPVGHYSRPDVFTLVVHDALESRTWRPSSIAAVAEETLTRDDPIERRAPEIIRQLSEAYPDAKVALKFSNLSSASSRPSSRLSRPTRP